jgi:hypothetical protein
LLVFIIIIEVIAWVVCGSICQHSGPGGSVIVIRHCCCRCGGLGLLRLAVVVEVVVGGVG